MRVQEIEVPQANGPPARFTRERKFPPTVGTRFEKSYLLGGEYPDSGLLHLDRNNRAAALLERSIEAVRTTPIGVLIVARWQIGCLVQGSSIVYRVQTGDDGQLAVIAWRRIPIHCTGVAILPSGEVLFTDGTTGVILNKSGELRMAK